MPDHHAPADRPKLPVMLTLKLGASMNAPVNFWIAA